MFRGEQGGESGDKTRDSLRSLALSSRNSLSEMRLSVRTPAFRTILRWELSDGDRMMRCIEALSNAIIF